MKPTGKTYTIRTVNDFLQVPPDRFKACMKDFSHAYATVSILKLQLNDKDFNWPGFIWTDDGKKEGKITITEKGEK